MIRNAGLETADLEEHGVKKKLTFNPDDGQWYAMTLGQFVCQLVESDDEAVVFRSIGESDEDADGRYCQSFEVITIPNGQVSEAIAGCKRVHKTLKALLEAGVVT